MLTFWLWSFFLLPSNWHEDHFLHTFTWFFTLFLIITVWHGPFFWYSSFMVFAFQFIPYLKYRVSVYTTFLKRRTRKLNFQPYVLNLIQINTSFHLSKVGSPEAILSAIRYQNALLVRPILLAIRATMVKSCDPICQPSMPIRQVMWASLSANHSQTIKYNMAQNHKD